MAKSTGTEQDWLDHVWELQQTQEEMAREDWAEEAYHAAIAGRAEPELDLSEHNERDIGIYARRAEYYRTMADM